VPLLIDGHNVIGSGVFDDIHLSDEDDEARFVARMRAWKSRYRGQVEIIFDHGITEGRSPELSGGGVETRFARNPTDADELIRRRIRKQTRGLILVTNDAYLRQEALEHQVEVWRPDQLVERFTTPLAMARRSVTGAPANSEANLPKQEVEAWLRIFKRKKPSENDDHRWTPPFQRPKRLKPASVAPATGDHTTDTPKDKPKSATSKKSKKKDGRRKR
jgi:predicted RNA-binding protein with PIN domain